MCNTVWVGTHEEDRGYGLVDPTVLLEKVTDYYTEAKQADKKGERNEVVCV